MNIAICRAEDIVPVEVAQDNLRRGKMGSILTNGRVPIWHLWDIVHPESSGCNGTGTRRCDPGQSVVVAIRPVVAYGNADPTVVAIRPHRQDIQGERGPQLP